MPRMGGWVDGGVCIRCTDAPISTMVSADAISMVADLATAGEAGMRVLTSNAGSEMIDVHTMVVVFGGANPQNLRVAFSGTERARQTASIGRGAASIGYGAFRTTSVRKSGIAIRTRD